MSSPTAGKRPTLLDVARVAGVSHQTVSRYLHVPERLKPATYEAVKAAVDALDYRPNLLARSMRSRQTGMVAIIMPGHTMPYSPARILASATAEAHRHGLQVEIVSVDGGARARFHRAMELVSTNLVEGVLSLAALEDVDRLREYGVVEVAECYDDNLNGTGELLDAAPVREIIERMISLGHRCFLHIGGPDDHPASIERRRVYRESVEALGVESMGVHTGPWDGTRARDIVAGLPEDSPLTAIIAGNDELAAGVIAGAAKRGWRVPDRLSVSGWDDNPVGALMPPALTTVRVDHASLGRAAMGRLISAVREEVGEPAPRPPLNTVMWRESVGRASLGPERESA